MRSKHAPPSSTALSRMRAVAHAGHAMFRGYIAGLRTSRLPADPVTELRIGSGAAWVPGAYDGTGGVVELAAGVTLTGVAAAQGLAWVYLQPDGTLVVDATAPTAYLGTAQYRTSDGARMVGAVIMRAANVLAAHSYAGDELQITETTGSGTVYRVLDAGAAVSPTQINFALFAPFRNVVVRLFGAAGGGSLTLTLPASTTEEMRHVNTGSRYDFVTTLPIGSNRTASYFFGQSGGELTVDVYGFRMER